MSQQKNIFSELVAIDVSQFIQQKNKLDYLSWAVAWRFIKEKYPTAKFKIREWDGKPYLFDEKLGYLVETSVEIDGETMSMVLPIMDGTNNAQKHIPYTYKVAEWVGGRKTGKMIEKTVEPATMFDINTGIMRCLVKNIALFGLGIDLYIGDDLTKIFDEEGIKEKEKPKEVWLTEEQFAQLKEIAKDQLKRVMVENTIKKYSGLVKEGKIFLMKEEFKEELKKILNNNNK